MRASSIAPRGPKKHRGRRRPGREQLRIAIEMHSDTLQRLAYYRWEIAARRYQPNCTWDRERNRDIIETPMIGAVHRARFSASGYKREGEGYCIFTRADKYLNGACRCARARRKFRKARPARSQLTSGRELFGAISAHLHRERDRGTIQRAITAPRVV